MHGMNASRCIHHIRDELYVNWTDLFQHDVQNCHPHQVFLVPHKNDHRGSPFSLE